MTKKAIESTERSYVFDNLKGFAILAVVLGHFIQPGIKSNQTLQNLFFFLYMWHMPLFCVISGVLSTYSKKPLWRKLASYLLYFGIGQMIYSGAAWILGLEASYYSLLWYLVALSAWTLIMPIVEKVRVSSRGNTLLLLLAISAGLAMGLVETEPLAVITPRIITYFPYFLMGVIFADYKKINLPMWPRQRVIGLSGFIAVALTLAMILNLDWINYRACFLNQGYETMEMSWNLGMAVRAALYVAGCAYVVLLLTLASKKPTQWAKLGKISLPIYLLHGILIKILTTLDLMPF